MSLTFSKRERARQVALRAEVGRYPVSGETAGRLGTKTYDVLLPKWDENLWEPIRTQAVDYFNKRKKPISWHRMRGHVLSSQICCINFLMPFAKRPDALAALLQPVFPESTIVPVAIDEVDVVDREPRFVAFEWAGHGNYLNEAADGSALTRGANSTSLDAMVLLEVDGRREMVLIEWKYTESYGAPLQNKMRTTDGGSISSNEVRLARYEGKLFHPDGPLKADESFTLKDLFWEPFYQFARQQMLAFQFEKPEHRAIEGGAERVSILHLAPRENVAFQKITAQALKGRSGTACECWKSLLERPDRFDSRYIDDLFSAFDAEKFGMSDWAKYIEGRYGWSSEAR